MSYENELEIVKSVYCRKGEFSHKVSGNALLKGFTLNLNESSEERLCVSFHFPENYPEKPPHIDIIYPKITKENNKKLNEDLLLHVASSSLLNDNMMLEVISWVRSNIPGILPSDGHEIPPQQVCVMRIDHMRAKKSYLKTLQKWTTELNLSATVVFIKQFIFAMVEGSEDSIQEFIKRLRSRKVDVDSSGHPCKERMMTILCRRPIYSAIIPPGFKVHEVCSNSALEMLYPSADYGELYSSIFKPVLS